MNKNIKFPLKNKQHEIGKMVDIHYTFAVKVSHAQT